MLLGATGGIDDEGERTARRAADDALAASIEADGVAAFVDRWLAQPLFAGVPDDPADRADRRANTAAGLASSLRLAGTGTQVPVWDRLPELTRETFTHKSHASSDGEARERALALDLDSVLDRLDRPALFVTGRRDRLIPVESTERQAQTAPHGSLVVLEEGNHVCANVPYRSRPLVADWVREHLA